MKMETAIVAGGCFWCMEPPFRNLKGVQEVKSGYTGGHTKNPTYEEVCEGTTGHIEAIQIEYDAEQVSYSQVLEVFWQNIDPTDAGGQFVDRGTQYASAIFYLDEAQKIIAHESKKNLESMQKFSAPIATQIMPAKEFYVAEDYHQGFYKKSVLRYKGYRAASGRDQFLEKVWRK